MIIQSPSLTQAEEGGDAAVADPTTIVMPELEFHRARRPRPATWKLGVGTCKGKIRKMEKLARTALDELQARHDAKHAQENRRIF